jgi:exopolysaccharide biosynthesis polyprenyl glycosylphosphotransferase
MAAASLGAFVLAWPFALGLHGSREPSVLGVGADEYRKVVGASMQLFAVVAVVAVLTDGELPARLWALVLATGTGGVLATRWLSRSWLNRQRHSGMYLTPAVVVGEPEDVRYVVRRIAAGEGMPYNILGVLLPGGRRGQSLTVDRERLPVLSSPDEVVQTVALKKAEAVIVAGPVPGGNQYVRELGWNLEEHDVELVLASSLTNVAGPRIHFRPVPGLPLMEAGLPRYSGTKHVVKRFTDLFLGAAALLALLPVLAVLAILVRLDSPGPVLARQECIGKDGKPFMMLKFRSTAPSAQARPSVTRCGAWMRRYSLDELPQVLNVLHGEMSLVGPRPLLAPQAGRCERSSPCRMLVKPGITGLRQISGRTDLEWDDSVRLDLYYVENWSLMGDLIILWRMIRAVVSPISAS